MISGFDNLVRFYQFVKSNVYDHVLIIHDCFIDQGMPNKYA